MNIVLRNRVPASRSFGPAAFDQFVGSIFDDLISAKRRDATAAESKTLKPRIDVSESETAYEVEAELPGVAKEDVRISVDGNRVSFEAERKSSAAKEGETMIHTERTVQNFARNFTLPAEVDGERVEAKLENGILRLVLPKKQAVQTRKITVQ